MEPELQRAIRNDRPRNRIPWGKLLLLGIGLIFLASVAALLLAPEKVMAKIKSGLRDVFAPKVVVQEKIVEREVVKEVMIAPDPPSKFVNYKQADLAILWSKIRIKSELDVQQGEKASLERLKPDSMEVEMKVQITVPKPNDSMDELHALNPHLASVLPSLPEMVKQGKVSPFYHLLYQRKVDRFGQNLTRIDRLIDKHNFYDLETVLELQSPVTGQRVLLAQGEMDVDTDGSDGDRMPEYDDYIAKSTYYQPFTSWGWKKTNRDQPNPLLPRWEEKLKTAEEKGDAAAVALVKREIADLKARSFLIARVDPYIVIPIPYFNHHSKNKWGPMIGDYAVVIFGNKAYPCIVGDAGPTYKFGEASYRLCKEINENSSPYRRPVSDLTVTYLIFPQNQAPRATPDHELWYQECQKLVDQIGGLGPGIELHRWPDYFAPETAAPATSR